MSFAQPTDDTKTVVDGANLFATDLYTRLADKPGNLFFSPYSIDSALAMTYTGAKGNTAKQMADVMHLSLMHDRLAAAYANLGNELIANSSYDDQKVFEFVIANALWGQKDYGYQSSFLNTLKTIYNAPLHEVDFLHSPDPSRLQINQWVQQITHDRIKDLLAPNVITAESRLVLTNAIYFKSRWDAQFSKGATQDADFHIDTGKTEQVPMMHLQRRLAYTDTDSFQAVELPYTSNQLSMIVVLPKKVDGLAEVEKQLTTGAVMKVLSPMRSNDVRVSFPKFKLESQFALADQLSAMGMTDAFDATKANFSAMVDEPTFKKEPPVISQVIHKAFVEVDEEGTEAAAATAVVMRAGSARMQPVEPVVFNADHPFLFFIRHNNTGAIVFMGRVMNPKE